MIDPSPAHPAPDPLRVLRRDQRRRRERRRPPAVAPDGSRGRHRRRRRKRQRPPGRRRRASIVAPPKDYEGIRLGPYKYIDWPDGEKELYDITKDPYELNNKARDANFFPIRTFLHNELRPARDLRRPHLPGTLRKTPADPRPAAEDQTGKGKGTAGTGKARRRNGNEKQAAETGAERTGLSLGGCGTPSSLTLSPDRSKPPPATRQQKVQAVRRGSPPSHSKTWFSCRADRPVPTWRHPASGCAAS